MSSTNSKLDLQTFCDLHQISKDARFVLNKKYGALRKSLDAWYDLVSKDFKIGEKFIETKIQQVVNIIADKPAVETVVDTAPLVDKIKEDITNTKK